MIDKKQEDPDADVSSHIKELMQKQKDKDKSKAAVTAPVQPKTASASSLPVRNANSAYDTVETTGEFTTSGKEDGNPYSHGW